MTGRDDAYEVPREYQLEIFERARHGNIVAFLPTGELGLARARPAVLRCDLGPSLISTSVPISAVVKSNPCMQADAWPQRASVEGTPEQHPISRPPRPRCRQREDVHLLHAHAGRPTQRPGPAPGRVVHR